MALQQQSFILISPKKAEQTEDRTTESVQNVSRRRMAFRPNSIKKNPAPPIAVHKIDIGEGKPQEPEKSSISGQSSQQQLNGQVNEMDKSRRIQWTLPEQAVFYEALKLHGKDFEAIAKFMIKRKIAKDKEQIRNFFLNNYKLWKGKAQIDESEWTNIPRDSRELFIVINGCEWRKRLESSFDQQKFKNLILDGVVSFRPKRKKFIVTIRTPYCPALLKYFPYDKRGADIPTHIDCKLKPLRNWDREYIVTMCEQNPHLQLHHINVNDKISSIFDFLEKKWLQQGNMIVNNNQLGVNDRIKLFIDGGTQVHKILIGIDEENSPLLSVNRLKKDFQLRQNENAETNCSIESNTKIDSCQNAKIDSIHGPASVRELFEINEEKIRLGLTKSNVGNASMLQLFYLLGMNSQLVFNYEICEQNYKTKPWELFLSLVVNRDYDELMAKSANSNCESRPQTIPRIDLNVEERELSSLMHCDEPSTSAMTKNKQKRVQTGNSNDIMEEEKMRFIRQIREQSARKPRRQVKLVHDAQKICNRLKPPTEQAASNSITRFIVLNGVVTQLDAQGQHINLQQNGLNGQMEHQNFVATDFSLSEPPPKRIILTQNPVIDLSGEISMDSSMSTPFHSTILDNSPNKSLPHDVRDAMSEMLKESSVDYCRKFEQLTRMHRENNSPTKLSITGITHQDQNGID